MPKAKRPVIYVAGLGPGTWSAMPVQTYQWLKLKKAVFLQTTAYSMVKDLLKQGISLPSLDDIDEQGKILAGGAGEEMGQRLLQAARERGEIVYVVPGQPDISDGTLRFLQVMADMQLVEVKMSWSPSFLDLFLQRVHLDPGKGISILDGRSITSQQIRPSMPTVVVQLVDEEALNRVTKALLSFFPREYCVTVGCQVGMAEEEHLEMLPLAEVDRLPWLGPLTTLYIPASAVQENDNNQFARLVEIVRQLRSPQGCPWDRKQTHRSLRKHLLEEAYEVADAIDREDPNDLCEELGDLLLQIALHAQMAEEAGQFNVHDVIRAINEKLIRRHPHVFAQDEARNAEEVEVKWEEIKRRERLAKGAPSIGRSLLDEVPRTFPAMLTAAKLQKKAASVGFDWPGLSPVIAKVEEEWQEFRAAQKGEEKKKEFGDLLFALMNLARFLQIDAEEALALTNEKFRQRFAYIEERLRSQGRSLQETDLEEMDRYWEEAKDHKFS